MSNIAYNLTCKGAKLLPKNSRNPELVKIFSEIAKLSLKPVKKVEYKLNPFDSRSFSIRELMYQFSAKNVSQTNRDVYFKTDILSNQDEPQATITFFNDYKLVFKTSNLSLHDMTFHYNRISVEFIKEME